MPENWIIPCLGGLAAFITNVFYQLGGISNKWIRRYLASFVLSATANVIAITQGSWSWKYILMYPCLIGGFSLGYGGDTTIQKVIKRTIYALGVLMACFCGFWACGGTNSAWVVLGTSFICGVASIVLGVLNPFKSARVEEFLVCQVLTLFVPFWGYVN